MAVVQTLVAGTLLFASGAGAANPGLPAAAAQPRSRTLSLPFAFEANRGQAPEHFPFVAQGRGCAFLLAPEEAVISLSKPEPGAAQTRPDRRRSPNGSAESAVRFVRLRLTGASAAAPGAGLEPMAGRVNYLLGNDPNRWHTDVPTYGKVCFREVYPGVSVIYYGAERQLEYDFVVSPQADPARIGFEITGADQVSVDANGDLVMQVDGVLLRQRQPVAFQTVNGRRVSVESRYQRAGPNRVEFRLGAYDRGQTLVIDPVFSYATYFGAGGETAWDVAVDAQGAAFIAGETTAARSLATAGAFQTNYGGGSTVGGDAFVAKLSPAGTNLLYLTYLGGSLHDGALALAVDGAGHAYLTGFTGSSNFPVAGPLKTNFSGVPDAKLKAHPIEGFVAKLGANGNALVYSAYVGGSGVDEGIGIAVDPAGSAYVTGFSESTNLPVTHALQAASGGNQDGFVAKVNPAGSAFEYLTYLGGTNSDFGYGIAADAAGFAYVTGATYSTNFWNTNAVQTQLNNPSNTVTTNISLAADAFVTKFTPAGALVYSTFLGGSGADTGFRIVADAAGNAYVVGAAGSMTFPVTSTNLDGAVWTNRGLSDVFITKVAPEGGTNWLYSIAFGGTHADEGWDLAVDARGRVVVIGMTTSTNFPAVAVPVGGSTTNQGLSDAFIAELTADGSALNYSMYYGGAGSDYGYGLELDPAGNLYAVGWTASTNLFVRNALTPVFPGGSSGVFVAKLVAPPVLSIVPVANAVKVQWPAPAPGFVLDSKTETLDAAWTPVSQPVAIGDGVHSVTVDSATNSAAYFRLRLP